MTAECISKLLKYTLLSFPSLILKVWLTSEPHLASQQPSTCMSISSLEEKPRLIILAGTFPETQGSSLKC